MDSKVKNILQEWGFDNLRCFFHVSRTPFDKFINLTESDIDRIIPDACEYKLSFKQFYSGYKTVSGFQTPDQEVTLTDKTPIIFLSDVVDEGINRDVVLDQIQTPLGDITNIHSQRCKDSYPQSKSLENTELAEEYRVNQKVNVNKTANVLNRLKTLDEAYSQIKKNKPLYKLLNQTLAGRAILFAYAESKNIKDCRQELCKIIIEKEMRLTLDTSYPFLIHATLFQDRAADIVDIFENENTILYYSKGYTVKETVKVPGKKSHRVNTSGILYDEYSSYRDYLKRAQLIVEVLPKPSKASNSARAEAIEIDLSPILNLPTGNIDVALVSEVWDQSFLHRQSPLYSNLQGIHLLQKFKILQTSQAPSLIIADFKKHYSHSKEATENNDLKTNWPIIAKQIIAFAKSTCDAALLAKKVKPSETETSESTTHQAEFSNTPLATALQTVIEISVANYSNIYDIFAKNEKIQNDEHSNSLAFLILPLLIKHTLKSKPNQWKPQKKDITSSFIRHIKSHEEIVELINSVNEFKIQNEIDSLHPYIIFCGSLHKLDCCHVIIDSFEYDFKNSIDAIDFLYKAFFILKVDYPAACPHVWAFFQMQMYDMLKYRRIVAKKNIAQLGIDLKRF